MPDRSGDAATHPLVSDDELAREALAAEPDPEVPDDAVPFPADDDHGMSLLPAWYMPAPSMRRTRGRTAVLAATAIALLVVNVGGVCVTYGVPDPVW